MSILTTPERLAQVLIDAHPSIRAGYHFTQGSVEQIERPCWLVFIEGASYPQTTVDQELVEQSYSCAFIGNIWNSADTEFSSEYELLARQVADSTVRYLFRHPQLQMSNERGVFPDMLTGLTGVQQVKVDGRSAVTLYSRDAIAGEAWWGFTIDLTIIEQMPYETVGF